MKVLAFPAAFGLIISLTTATPALHEKKDGKSSEKIERSMPVDPHATITVCVMSGGISARGWDKNEIRVRQSGAEFLEFRRIDKVKDKDKEPQMPSPATRVDVMITDDKTNKLDCQAIADVELEVPYGATVQVQTRDGDINIVGVAAAYAGSQNGDISIERASKLVEAGSVGGSISLKDSSGRINLSSAGGVVDVTNCKPASAEDTFEVGTVSGDIQLNHVSNRKLIAKTVNGTVTMSGALARGGHYGFSTLSGDVVLQLPTDSSFHIVAKLSDNREIVSDFKLKFMETPPPPPPARNPMPGGVIQGRGPGTPPPTQDTPTPPATKSKEPKVSEAPVVKSPTPKVKVGPGTVVIKSPVVMVSAAKRVTAMYGSGDAMISVSSFSGTLHLKKL
jgi:Putative adhesin